MSTIESMNMFTILSQDKNNTVEDWESEVNQVINQEINQDFPTLSESASVTEKKPKPKKFVVAHSYAERKVFSRQYPAKDFSKDLSKTLACTKPCNHVLKKADESGVIPEEYGVCYREICTFAHSLAELQLPRCAFGDKCYRRNDKSNLCQFSHPGEGVDEFYTRTGKNKPDLPATSEATRKPKAQEKFVIDLSHHDELPKQEKRKEYKPKDKSAPPNPVKSGAWAKPINKKLTEETTIVIRVPKELAQNALEVALTRGLTDFRVETF